MGARGCNKKGVGKAESRAVPSLSEEVKRNEGWTQIWGEKGEIKMDLGSQQPPSSKEGM